MIEENEKLMITEKYNELYKMTREEIINTVSPAVRKIMEQLLEYDGVVVTHGGQFHADDVFSAALLDLVAFPLSLKCTVKRGCDYSTTSGELTFDTGGGVFDHHQPNAKHRENGVKYAAFGLLWKEIGSLFFYKEEEIARFDERFIQPLDTSDNFGVFHEIANLISQFNPTWDGKRAYSFGDAVSVAKMIIINQLVNIESSLKAEKEVIKAVENATKEGIVILEEYMPWHSSIDGTKNPFVIFKSRRQGEWNAQIVPVDGLVDENGSPKGKYRFPIEWGGLRNKELEEKSGVGGMLFCHATGFLIATDSKEAAIEACKKAIV